MIPTHPRQPLLSDAIIALRAPTQVWSDATGDLGAAPIHGVYHGDLRHVRALWVQVEGSDVESISHVALGADRVRFGSVLRGLDADQPDPYVRILRDRFVTAGAVNETATVRSHRAEPIEVVLQLHLRPDFAPLQAVKAGIATALPWQWDDGTVVGPDGAQFRLRADGAAVSHTDDTVTVTWTTTIPARSEAQFTWTITPEDPSLVVTAPAEPAVTAAPTVTDPRLARWVQRATEDLDALRLALPEHPDDAFYAAGAPWFFTLFGRDSIWAARLALPLDPAIAVSTLRVLARLQGTTTDPAIAEAPGKIPHELRSAPLTLPNENVTLPPLYYGTVDATPLWVCLLADARDGGMAEPDVRDLLPHLRAALGWMREHGDASGSGFIDYVDETGHGLANQGWKDSGDSIQWRDGRLADGPIALCEVQGYAYEAAMRGAEILSAFGADDAEVDGLRTWAADLRIRFRERYWVTTPEGHYPAIALDAHGDPVDTLTSNIGHLIGTGILDPEEERACADLLTGPTMSSGFGVRTMSTEAAGYWPLSYHGGTVWAHDTAIGVHGMTRTGLHEPAGAIVQQLIDAAEGFAYRMPELHSGDGIDVTPRPTPYPASCRPQAWSAAAAITCAVALQAGA